MTMMGFDPAQDPEVAARDDERMLRLQCLHAAKDLLGMPPAPENPLTANDLVDAAKRVYGWVTAHDEKFNVGAAKAANADG